MLRIQQLYGEIKYRGVFVEAGMKEHDSPILPQSLTSGDLVESGNARPIPQIRAGFGIFRTYLSPMAGCRFPVRWHLAK